MRRWLRSITGLGRPLHSRPLQFALQFGLAGSLLWVWGHNLNWRSLAQLIEPHQVAWLPAVAGLALGGSLLRAWRWRVVVDRQSKLGIVRAFLINEGANLVNVLVPARLGDVLRMLWLRRWCRLPAGSGAGMVMADHAIELGVATVMLSGAAIAYLSIHGVGATGLSLAADAAGTIVLLALLAGSVYVAPRLVRSTALQRLAPIKLAEWLREHAHHFEAAGPMRIGPARAIAGAALTFAAFCLDALMLSALFASLGISLPVMHSLAVCLALVPGYAVPSFGGFGPVELIGTFAVQAGGSVVRTAAAAGILAFHLAGVLITVGVGAIALALLGPPARLASESAR